ncbi:hypothetical protein B0H13DRAFT_1874285 [Mycena leptocephala]|nr:hypothetical protein B0H13DRAFT_1874285 [Mycena leptocephala]
MSTSQSFPKASTSSSPPLFTGAHLLLPSLSLSPISDLEGEGFSHHLSRRRSVASDDSKEAEKQRDSTAARRASHNAVERQRRDKLNARILELASYCPISLASRRHRMLASQQLRALHAENEALRGEVNQWRHRAGVPGVLEPRRGDAFMLVLTGAELELEPVDACDEEEFDDQYTNAMMFSRSHQCTNAPSPGRNRSRRSPTPLIACPTPANAFEAQHFMLKTEDELAMYGRRRHLSRTLPMAPGDPRSRVVPFSHVITNFYTIPSLLYHHAVVYWTPVFITTLFIVYMYA